MEIIIYLHIVGWMMGGAVSCAQGDREEYGMWIIFLCSFFVWPGLIGRALVPETTSR